MKLGYKTDPITNGFEFDTSIRGNSNKGHEFRKDYSKNKEIKGVIGPDLVAGRSKGADRIPQDALGIFRAGTIAARARGCQARVTAGTGSCRRN